MRKALVVIAGLVAAALAVLIAIKVRYGGATRPFPERTTPPLLSEAEVEIVASLDEAPGNIAVSETGRVFFSFHPEGRPSLKVVELREGRPVPWPDMAFQSKRGGGEPFFDCVLSLRIDRQGRLWTLDHGFHGLRQPRLLAFELATGRLVHRFDIPRAIAGWGSYVQDFQVDPEGKTVFMADVGALAKKPAFLVYDVLARTARRLLEGHASVVDQPYLINARGRPMILLDGLYAMHPGLDSITLDRQGEWLYYGPMSHEDLFRVRARDLADPSLSAAELARRVETFGPKVQSDGLSTDLEGNVFLTDVEHGAISILGPDRRLRTLVRDERIRWPDGLSFGPEGWLYLTDSALPDIMLRSRAHIRASAPYFIFRLKPGTAGIPGS